MRLESNVAQRILTVSESWITESSNLTEERLDIVFKRCHVPKRMTCDVGFGGVKCHAIFAEPDMNGAQA